MTKDQKKTQQETTKKALENRKIIALRLDNDVEIPAKTTYIKDLNYASNDEIVEIAKTELKLKRLGVSKHSINFFKKSITPKEHLRLVLQKNKSV